jgi:hypothetical protein
VVGQVAALREAELDAAGELADPSVALEVLRAARPVLDGLSAHELDLLASDRLRHTGVLGRIVATGTSAESVRAVLLSLLDARIGV